MTIGHSTRTLEEFIDLLQTHGASCVMDVRTVPRSRHNPQFNEATLPRPLKEARLGCLHQPGLGGLRHAKSDKLNVGWRNASFRGYADYMQTTEFTQNDLDRFHLVSHVIKRVPTLDPRAAYAKEALRDNLIEHKQYIAEHGEDMPEFRN